MKLFVCTVTYTCKYVVVFEELLHMEESRKSSWSNKGCTFNLQHTSILSYSLPIEITPWSLNAKPALGKCFVFW